MIKFILKDNFIYGILKCPYLKNKQCPVLKNKLDDQQICVGYSCDNPSYVYIVLCKDGTFYTGFTRNIIRRMKEHQTGRGAKWCKYHGFKEYSYIQCSDAGDGHKLELIIKKWSKEKKQKFFELHRVDNNYL